jgi:splicing factor 3B subunit 4
LRAGLADRARTETAVLLASDDGVEFDVTEGAEESFLVGTVELRGELGLELDLYLIGPCNSEIAWHSVHIDRLGIVRLFHDYSSSIIIIIIINMSHNESGMPASASNMYKHASLAGFGGPHSQLERNQEATVYVGNLEQRVTNELLWELFLQVGQVINVHIPRDKITNEHQGYGFVEFKTEEDADYAIKILHFVKLFQKPLKVNKASQDKRTQEVGANVFVGNLSDNVDEKMLRDVFSSFGIVLATKIMRDVESGQTKRYGFVSFDNFDSSDAACRHMKGQYLEGKPIDVSYAYKKDACGEKHGSLAERKLAYS